MSGKTYICIKNGVLTECEISAHVLPVEVFERYEDKDRLGRDMDQTPYLDKREYVEAYLRCDDLVEVEKTIMLLANETLLYDNIASVIKDLKQLTGRHGEASIIVANSQGYPHLLHYKILSTDEVNAQSLLYLHVLFPYDKSRVPESQERYNVPAYKELLFFEPVWRATLTVLEEKMGISNGLQNNGINSPSKSQKTKIITKI